MKRIAYLLTTIVFLMVVLFTIKRLVQKPVQAAPIVATHTTIPIDSYSDGRININTQGVFGPQTCTSFGDPFSPWNSVWEPGAYTYTYRIKIPADYAEDIVRVEIFDPDSINAAGTGALITYSNNAQHHPTMPFPINAVKNCGIDGGDPAQREPCVLRTDELTLTHDIVHAYSFDQVNPHWFVRIDENRGGGVPSEHGDGTCTAPTDIFGEPLYEPLFNTQTLFTLYYLQDVANKPTQRVDLASYLGNTGDGRPGDAAHLTDLHWVSPGADKQGLDYPIPNINGVAEVPTIEGNTSFEIDLNVDVPEIVAEATTGDRYLYLDIQSVSGASENAFHIWAGPATYVDAVPSGGNERNLYILNNFGSHHAKGIEVEAIRRMPSNNVSTAPGNFPIDDFMAVDADGTVSVSIFDMDVGAEGPITFFFDSIPESSWSLAFSAPGVDDPDGVPTGTRCEIEESGCNDQWISPAYQITLPGDLSNCDPLNPTQADCTPFFGGRLMVRVNGSIYYDTYVWEIAADLPETYNMAQSCAAFPITITMDSRSVTLPGMGSHPYPLSNEFDYPEYPPVYGSFIDHISDVPLDDAKEGMIYKVTRNEPIDGFDWLVWNVGIEDSDGSVLSNSLTWPGDSFDY
ncbi:MAG: hypothetical protein GY943_12170, partial [Chloroflexi bacterium]|nr:hypothetical protein [Chloroflexota bacterium]